MGEVRWGCANAGDFTLPLVPSHRREGKVGIPDIRSTPCPLRSAFLSLRRIPILTMLADVEPFCFLVAVDSNSHHQIDQLKETQAYHK